MVDINDDEAMLRSFEQFMLGSGGGDGLNMNSPATGKSITSKKGRQKGLDNLVSTPPSRSAFESPSQRKQDEKMVDKVQRKCWRIFRGFCSTIQNEWIAIDDQLLEVVSSIENIRSRIPLEMKLLSRLKDDISNNCLNGKPQSRGTMSMTQCDVNLSLCHDLLQHERMMYTLRSLLSDLASSLQALGRRLDEAYHHHLAACDLLKILCDEDCDDKNESKQPHTLLRLHEAMQLMDHMNEMFSMLSRELYRKQCLSLYALDSVDNKILVSGAAERDNGKDSGYRAAIICTKEWPRGSKASSIHIQRFQSMLRKGSNDEFG